MTKTSRKKSSSDQKGDDHAAATSSGPNHALKTSKKLQRQAEVRLERVNLDKQVAAKTSAAKTGSRNKTETSEKVSKEDKSPNHALKNSKKLKQRAEVRLERMDRLDATACQTGLKEKATPSSSQDQEPNAAKEPSKSGESKGSKRLQQKELAAAVEEKESVSATCKTGLKEKAAAASPLRLSQQQSDLSRRRRRTSSDQAAATESEEQLRQLPAVAEEEEDPFRRPAAVVNEKLQPQRRGGDVSTASADSRVSSTSSSSKTRRLTLKKVRKRLDESKAAVKVTNEARAISTPNKTILRQNVTFAEERSFDVSSITVLSPKTPVTLKKQRGRATKAAEITDESSIVSSDSKTLVQQESFQFVHGKKDLFEEMLHGGGKKPPTDSSKRKRLTSQAKEQPAKKKKDYLQRAVDVADDVTESDDVTDNTSELNLSAHGRPIRQRKKNRKYEKENSISSRENP